MKSVQGFSGANVTEYRGDVIPLTDIDQEKGVEWITPEGEDLGSHAVRSAVLTELIFEDMPSGYEVDVPIPSWQRDRFTYANLGIAMFTAEDFRTLLAPEYDTWQRIIRRYEISLKNRAGRIRRAEGQVEFQELGKLYGSDRSVEELLRYASELEVAADAVEVRGLIDHTLDGSITRRKLKNAPDPETVLVVSDGKRLHLEFMNTQKRSA